MAFVTLDGFTIAVTKDSPKRRLKRRGNRKRAFKGQMRDSQRGRRREWSMKTCFESHADGTALLGLINGEGHVVSFRSGFDADTGLTPEVGFLSSVRLDKSLTPFPLFDGGSIIGDVGEIALRYDPQFEEDWTVHWWEQENAGDWHHIAMRSDGKSWLDGVEDDSVWQGAYNWIVKVLKGRVELSGQGSGETPMHQLAMLPYRATASMISAWAVSTTPLAGLPVLRLEGDIIATDHEFVVGEVSGVEYIGHGGYIDDGFPWVNNAMVIDFAITELATEFIADYSVESQGSIVAPPAPVTPEEGDFAFTQVSKSTSTRWAGVDVKDEAVPATVLVANQGPGGGVYSHLASYKLGLLQFVRTVGANANGATASWMSFDKLPDGSFCAVGYASTSSTLVTIRDEAGVTIGTIAEPPGAHNVWSYYALFSSTGALVWTQAVGHSANPTSNFVQDRLLAVCVVGERLFIAGASRWVSNGGSNVIVPVFGGLAYPSLPTTSQHSQGAYIVELDPLTGNGLNIVCCDNFASTTTTTNSIWFSGQDNRGFFLEPDDDGLHLTLSFSYNGHRTSGTGFVNIGRNKAGSFATRICSDSSQLDDGTPVIARFTIELEPVNALTSAQDNILSSPVSSRALPGKPVVSVAGKLYLPWQTCNTGEGAANTNRNPSPYATNAPNVFGDGGNMNLISVVANTLSDPRDSGNFSLGLAALTTTTTEDSRQGNATISFDDAKVLLAMRGVQPGSGTKISSFLGEPNITWYELESWLIAADVVTGAVVWQTRISAPTTGEQCRILTLRQYKTGPYAEEIHALALIEDGAGVYGAHNASDDVVAYDAGSKWSNGLVAANGMSCLMLVFNDAGEVLPSKCYPVYSGSMDFSNSLTEFRIF